MLVNTLKRTVDNKNVLLLLLDYKEKSKVKFFLSLDHDHKFNCEHMYRCFTAKKGILSCNWVTKSFAKILKLFNTVFLIKKYLNG